MSKKLTRTRTNKRRAATQSLAERLHAATQALLEKASGGPLTFGRLLKSTRQCDGFTQASLAAKLGIQRTHLAEIETARRSVSPTRAARFANLLGYHPELYVKLAIEADLRRRKLAFAFNIDTTAAVA